MLRCRDACRVRRLAAIAAIYDGASRSDAARVGGMQAQTLRDWVYRFNAEGPAGLSDRPHPGATPRLSADQMVDLIEIVHAGPDPASDGVVRWRACDLQAVIEQRFGVTYHVRSVSRLLHQLGFSHVSARPRHPSQDASVVADYKKNSLPPWPDTALA